MDLERNAMVASKVSNFPQFLIRAKKSFLMWGRVFCTAKQGIQHQLEELYTTSINLKIVHFRELELEISFHHSRCFYSRELLFCAPAAATSSSLERWFFMDHPLHLHAFVKSDGKTWKKKNASYLSLKRTTFVHPIYNTFIDHFIGLLLMKRRK